MKKFASVVAAGAILLSVTGVAFARHNSSSVVQFGSADSTTVAVSNSGLNGQFGGSNQHMTTGDANSAAVSLTAGNVNVGEGSGNVFQGSTADSLTVAGSNSGLNGQFGGSSHSHHGSSQTMSTGDTGSFAGSATVSNVSVSL